jgi:hypothetical protein
MTRIHTASTAAGLVAGLLCLPTLFGCGPQGPRMADVKGTVTLDGKAVDGAIVAFQPDQGTPATATTDMAGAFKLRTIVGNNTVTVIKSEIVDEVAAKKKNVVAGPVSTKLLLPSKYSVPQASGLNYDVQRGMQPVKIELTSR